MRMAGRKTPGPTMALSGSTALWSAVTILSPPRLCQFPFRALATGTR